jgi:hypothetical protein
LSRDQLAAAFDETARQQAAGGYSDSRRAAVYAIGKFLKLPLRGDRHFEVISGDRE